MSERPHSVAIGAFIVGALVIAIGAIFFISGTGLGSGRDKVVMVFDGSVKGLTLGAPVALRGVQIGQVTDIKLVLDTETIEVIMVVEAELNPSNLRYRGRGNNADYTDELIARGMRAQLNTQSLLTGLLYVQLDFHPESEVQLVDIESDYTQIPTIPTDLERITREIAAIDIPRMTEHLATIAESLSSFTSDEAFQQIPADIQSTLRSVAQLSEQVNAQLQSSGPRLDQVLEQAASTVETANMELPKLSGAARDSLAQLTQAITAFEQAASNAQGMLAPDSATTYQLNQALAELAGAGRALRLLARSLEEQPEALLKGRKEEPK